MAAKTQTSIYFSLPFFIMAFLSLALSACFLLSRPDWMNQFHASPHVTSLAHLYILGFILSAVFGSLYQLVPVALETKLYSPRLTYWHFACHSIGVPGMVLTFLNGDMKSLGHFGCFVVVGVILCVINLSRTLTQIPKVDGISAFMASALLWLGLNVNAGLILAANKHWNFIGISPLALLHAHAHLGAIGIFLMLIVGISFKLVPMFLLSSIQSTARVWGTLILLNSGLITLFWGLAFEYPSVAKAGTLLMASGLIFYTIEIISILYTRKRRSIDGPMLMFFAALLFLIPSGILGWILLQSDSMPGFPLAYATTLFGGVFGFAIMGMLYKIVPFLIWFHRFSPWIGQRELPTLSDLYSHKILNIGAWLYGISTLLLSIGFYAQHPYLFSMGVIGWSVSIVLFLVNMSLILMYPSPK